MKNSFTKIMMTALLLTMAVPCVNAQIAHVGDILCTTGVYVSPAEYEASGLEAIGVIFYVDATGQHGWAAALECAGTFRWAQTYGSPLTKFGSVRAAIYDMDGLFNCQEVLRYGATHNQSYPAIEALDIAAGWYLPALGQLNYFYGNLLEINAGLVACGHSPLNMQNDWILWSSTEQSGDCVWNLSASGKLSTRGTSSINRFNTNSVWGIRNF